MRNIIIRNKKYLLCLCNFNKFFLVVENSWHIVYMLKYSAVSLLQTDGVNASLSCILYYRKKQNFIFLFLWHCLLVSVFILLQVCAITRMWLEMTIATCNEIFRHKHQIGNPIETHSTILLFYVILFYFIHIILGC